MLWSLAPYTHEDVETRMLLHAVNSSNKGHQRIMLRTVDTYVFDLAVSTAAFLENTEIWVAFGTGKHLRYIFHIK